jgi:hypothetical protein
MGRSAIREGGPSATKSRGDKSFLIGFFFWDGMYEFVYGNSFWVELDRLSVDSDLVDFDQLLSRKAILLPGCFIRIAFPRR